MSSIEVDRYDDGYIRHLDEDTVDWYNKQSDYELYQVRHSTIEGIIEWFKKTPGLGEFDVDGDLVRMVGIPYPLERLLNELLHIYKPERRLWVTVEFDAYACDEEAVEEQVKEMLGNLSLSRGTENIKVEDYYE